MEELQNDQMRLQVDITEELKTRLKLQSVRESVTMSDVVEKALEAYLNQVEQQSNTKAK